MFTDSIHIYIYIYMQTSNGVKAIRTNKTHTDIDRTACMDACKKYHKTACTSLTEDEHLDVLNMSKAL
jgi:hypothetical protein